MRPLRLRLFAGLIVIFGLSACSTGPNGETGGPSLSWLTDGDASLRNAKTVAKTAANKEPDPGGVGSVPIIGPILAALFRPDASLPEDEEIPVEEKTGVGPVVEVADPDDEDRTPPKVNVHFAPNDRLRVHGEIMKIRGHVIDDSEIVRVTVNGRPARLNNRSFSVTMDSPYGYQQVEIAAVDSQGNVTRKWIDVERQDDRVAEGRVPIDRNSIDVGRFERQKFVRRPDSDDPRTKMRTPGVYMVLLPGTPEMHIVPMPTLKDCRQAVEFSLRAACTVKTASNRRSVLR